MNKHFLILYCSLFFCTYFSNAQNSKEDEEISPNFLNFKGVLLIKKPPYTLLTNVLEKRLNKFYKGEYKIIECNDQNNECTEDSKTFPYLIKIVSDGTINGASFFKIVMTDRVTGTNYKSKRFPDNTIPMYSGINRYLKALEKLRGK